MDIFILAISVEMLRAHFFGQPGVKFKEGVAKYVEEQHEE